MMERRNRRFIPDAHQNFTIAALKLHEWSTPYFAKESAIPLASLLMCWKETHEIDVECWISLKWNCIFQGPLEYFTQDTVLEESHSIHYKVKLKWSPINAKSFQNGQYFCRVRIFDPNMLWDIYNTTFMIWVPHQFLLVPACCELLHPR